MNRILPIRCEIPCRRQRPKRTTKADPDHNVIEWLRRNERDIAVDPVILGEIRFGILLLPKGKRRASALGTSPIAWSVPRRGGQPPILLDYATSAVAQGKVQIARAKGESVPLGWIIDSQGRPTTDVDEFFRGGAQLPFGGHKGYALALIVSLLSIGLSAGDELDRSEHASCLFVVCIDPAAFRPAEALLDYVEQTAARIKAVPPAEGFEEVLLPGEPEARSRIARSREGIPVSDAIWAELVNVAQRLGADSANRAIRPVTPL